MQEMHVLEWDFFGPRAQGTAEHFLVHLKEFFKKEEVHAEQMLCEPADHSCHVKCSVLASDSEKVCNALRPKRMKIQILQN